MTDAGRRVDGADKAAASALPGVRYGRLVRHGDSRGAFRELWRQNEPDRGGYPGTNPARI